jgi:hypothetical protein
VDPYATSADLTAWLPDGTVVADAERLLRRASELVDDVVRRPYGTDDSGIPTDADIAEALRDACCAQVEQWLEVGEANDVDGLAGDQVSVTGYSGHRAPRLAPRALRILRNAGLLSSAEIDTTASRFFATQTGG